RPGEGPGNGAQAAQVVRLEAPAGPRAEPQALDKIDRRGLVKVLGELRRFVDELSKETAAVGSQLLGVRFPASEQVPSHALRVQQVSVEHGGYELLQVPLGDGRVRILERDHLTLLGDANAASGRNVRLSPHAAVGLASSPVDGAPDAVKKTQTHTV